MKQCSKCKQDKSISEFSRWLNKTTGLEVVNSKCKTCVSAYSRNRYAEKRIELRAKMKEYYAEHRKTAVEKANAYYKANKDKVLEGRRKNYDANKSIVLIKIAEWKAKNPDKVKAMQSNWVNANREKVRASANKYARANKEKAAERWQAMRLMVMEAYGGPICSCCDETIYKFLTIDHINEDGAIHRAAIGKHLYRWLIENDYPPGFQVLCGSCNMGKHLNGGVCPHKDLDGSTTRAKARRTKRSEVQGAPKGR